jgi:hypothetical protein
VKTTTSPEAAHVRVREGNIVVDRSVTNRSRIGESGQIETKLRSPQSPAEFPRCVRSRELPIADVRSPTTLDDVPLHEYRPWTHRKLQWDPKKKSSSMTRRQYVSRRPRRKTWNAVI